MAKKRATQLTISTEPTTSLLERLITQAFVSGQMDGQATLLDKRKNAQAATLKALSERVYQQAQDTARQIATDDHTTFVHLHHALEQATNTLTTLIAQETITPEEANQTATLVIDFRHLLLDIPKPEKE